MRLLIKYKHYIPLLFFALAQVSLSVAHILQGVALPHKLYALIKMGLAISFVYAITKEAKKFQTKGKYGAIYRVMFAAGMIFYDCVFSAIEHFFK